MFGGYWTNSRRLGWILISLVVLIGARPGFCDSGVELLLEQSPADGGSLDLGTGMHTYASGTEITITAKPQSGYRFSYWLGDVSDPTTCTTTIRLDESRAVIAVYEPMTMGLGEDELIRSGGGGGGGGGGRLMANAQDFYSSSFSLSGSGGSSGATGSSEVSVISVPEPSTIVLLGVGILGCYRRRKNKIKPLY